MTKVGSRKLKNRLGSYLARVKRGEAILVTDRGKPVARLIPVESEGSQRKTEEELLKDLAATGSLTLGTGSFARFKPIRAKGKPLSRLVIEDRE